MNTKFVTMAALFAKVHVRTISKLDFFFSVLFWKGTGNFFLHIFLAFPLITVANYI